jgi:hypothetical protein
VWRIDQVNIETMVVSHDLIQAKWVPSCCPARHRFPQQALGADAMRLQLQAA